MFEYKSLVKNVIGITMLLALFSPVLSGQRIQVESSGISLSKALVRSRQGDTLVLAPGQYRGKFVIPPRVTVMAEKLHEAVINGNGQNRAVNMMNGATIYGLSITGAKVGVYSEGIDNKIAGCKIYGNRHSGVLAVSNLPVLIDNIIFRNQGSGISLWDVQGRNNVISHNTIVYNTNHGITIGGTSDVTITDNIIAFNSKLKIKLSEESKITQQFNNYFYNVEINELLPEDNLSFNPDFENAFLNDFRVTDSSHCINNGSNGSTIGTEIFTNFKN